MKVNKQKEIISIHININAQRRSDGQSTNGFEKCKKKECRGLALIRLFPKKSSISCFKNVKFKPHNFEEACLVNFVPQSIIENN